MKKLIFRIALQFLEKAAYLYLDSKYSALTQRINDMTTAMQDRVRMMEERKSIEHSMRIINITRIKEGRTMLKSVY